jgi:hypothetical protein
MKLSVGDRVAGLYSWCRTAYIADRKFEIVSIREASESEKKLYIKKVE